MFAPGAEVPRTAAPPPAILGLGYCTYDILAIVPRLPAFDDVRMVHVSGMVEDGGGQVGTALTAVTRLGTRAGYVGLLGDDEKGHWLRQQFVDEGIDVARLRLEPGTGTNVCLILVEGATARRAILCAARTDPDALQLEQADRAAVQAARALHLDGQFMPAAIQAAGWAREAGTKVSFDGNHPRPGLDELLPLVDWLVVAEPFPAAYTGLSDAFRAAQALLDLGPELLVVTLGERGCAVWTPTSHGIEHFQVPGFSVNAVDTTGAGDAFHGAFLHAMLQGWDLRRAAAFANAVGAINCRTLGGRRGLPTRAQVDLFLARRS